ncbi:hypothetical protein [Flavobacterium tructae]|uniref:Uncharacterized protein n=1 Tax=Flavobacterium tructae TaxID=1114873 RepID=A0A1S1J1G2_9FLAO|nr:hypothetical protein [Flavobacterium tructae]OHT44447.1 hypothetical protein BHE19_12060 [Flavobacterium tructae]OXB19417.1 hypothetical protein B0A71_12810 [Flavobacterium tructae]
MNNETKVFMIGAGPTAEEMAIVAKKLSAALGRSLFECRTILENAASEMNQLSEVNIKSLQDLSDSLNKLKKTHEFDKPKSKYINKPQINFRKIGIPQKRNNQRY